MTVCGQSESTCTPRKGSVVRVRPTTMTPSLPLPASLVQLKDYHEGAKEEEWMMFGRITWRNGRQSKTLQKPPTLLHRGVLALLMFYVYVELDPCTGSGCGRAVPGSHLKKDHDANYGLQGRRFCPRYSTPLQLLDIQVSSRTITLLSYLETFLSCIM